MKDKVNLDKRSDISTTPGPKLPRMANPRNMTFPIEHAVATSLSELET